MSADKIFWTGAVLSVIGIVLTIFGDQWIAQLADPVDIYYGTAGSFTAVLREVCLILGLVLLGSSPLARIIETRTSETRTSEMRTSETQTTEKTP